MKRAFDAALDHATVREERAEMGAVGLDRPHSAVDVAAKDRQLLADAAYFSQLAGPKIEEREVFVASGPRPLALFVQVDELLEGAHRLFARFIDEAESRRRRAAER